MTKLVRIALCLVLFGSVTSTTRAAPPAVADAPALPKKYADVIDYRPDQPYVSNDNPKQQLDLFLPKKPNGKGPLPIVVFIHGGGWVNGDRKGYTQRATELASTGDYAAASVGYRLSQEAIWPNQIHDCKAAIRYLRGHAKELNIDPDRIGVTGSSAGGHLVTLLGLTGDVKELEGDLGDFTSQSSRVTSVVNFCGPTDLSAPLMTGEGRHSADPAVSGLLGGAPAEKAEAAKQASPLTYVSKRAVPIMTIHGTSDTRVDFKHAERLDTALKEAGATSLLIAMKGAPHGIPVGPELAARIRAFWDLTLRDKVSDISVEPIDVTAAVEKK